MNNNLTAQDIADMDKITGLKTTSTVPPAPNAPTPQSRLAELKAIAGQGSAPAPQPTVTPLSERLKALANNVTEATGLKGTSDVISSYLAKAMVPEDQRKYIETPTVGQTLGAAAQLGSTLIAGPERLAAGLATKAIPKLAAKVLGGAGQGYAYETGGKFAEGKDTSEALTPGLMTALGAAGPLIAPTAKAGVGLAKEGVNAASDLASKAKTSLFGSKPVKSIDDVVKQADEGLKTPAETLKATEEATAKPGILEKWAGIRPDIKNRISGKQEKLKEYFDVAHARNNYDTLPTPLEHGAKQVENAVSKMDTVLNDTGSKIGTFRNKIGTYEAPIQSVSRIENTFNQQLRKLNLEVKNGAIRKIPGTVTRVGSDNEVNVLQDLYGELQTVKQNPNLQKLIDLRTIFDNKINFAKSARDVSSSLDPFSRTMRKQIADVGAEVVGKSEAKNLKKYSDFMEAYNNLRSFTDRKAGGEFLLKQVLSERGGSAREVINTIKDVTGIDLMDDAVMSQIATDLIGNAAQKGVFRQELTKAGLDTAALIQGNPSGAINLLYDVAKKTAIDPEKQFLKAAR